jgi:hypothetical protein
MSLLLAFDDITARGNYLLYDKLHADFKTRLLDINQDLLTQLEGGICLFTTSTKVAQIVGSFIKTILFANDPMESWSPKSLNNNNSYLKSLDSIYVPSSALATSFLNVNRIRCKIQYPYAPKKQQTTHDFILYNKNCPQIDQLRSQFPNEFYKDLQDTTDFARAKLYIHIPEPEEQWNINIILAHSHGVPCMTYRQGCVSEFCTGGDKIVSPDDSRSWISNFKIALRDYVVNSKIVHDMSQRFQVMGDLQEKIKKLMRQNNVRGSKQPTFAEAQTQAANAEAIKRLTNRTPVDVSTFVQKIVRPAVQRDASWDNVFNYINTRSNIYAGCGGIGDALLTLALAFKDPQAGVVFGASGHAKDFIIQMFKTCNIDALVTNNFNGGGSYVWDSILDSPNFKGAGHIPRNLNYSDWCHNSQHYVNQLVTRIPLIETFGKMLNLRNTKGVVGFCPRGSDHHSTWKQRFLTKDEYNRVISKLLSQDKTVIVFGAESDLEHYGVYANNNVIFMNSNFAQSYPSPRYPITMRHMFSCINGCEEIISMDTWLKTYAGLAGIPCKVIMNRHHGQSSPSTDPSDGIFLNQSVWNLQLVPIESF